MLSGSEQKPNLLEKEGRKYFVNHISEGFLRAYKEKN